MPAPWAYVDTSVLLKRYVAEPGSPQARRLLRRHRVVTSAVAPVEALSALHRRHAARDVAEADFRAIIARLARDRLHWELLEVTGDVLERAEGVVRRTGVRTLDAVHLASALVLHAMVEPRDPAPPFITADLVQRGAAATLGLEVLWVG
jgi:predicted nucleic acid-binding protein